MKGLESEGRCIEAPVRPWSSEPRVTLRVSFLEGGKTEGTRTSRLEGCAGPGAWWSRAGAVPEPGAWRGPWGCAEYLLGWASCSCVRPLLLLPKVRRALSIEASGGVSAWAARGPGAPADPTAVDRSSRRGSVRPFC